MSNDHPLKGVAQELGQEAFKNHDMTVERARLMYEEDLRKGDPSVQRSAFVCVRNRKAKDGSFGTIVSVSQKTDEGVILHHNEILVVTKAVRIRGRLDDLSTSVAIKTTATAFIRDEQDENGDDIAFEDQVTYAAPLWAPLTTERFIIDAEARFPGLN